ncbi:type I glutamate--ammonia ligase [Mucisphaera calidilacus]|uniref:Glutamine synthetase n=1 Tax=Mucisphaera calidilacus TaxID=2527982 RepID=A0A518BZU2_9BACT|nr:type I glutamate--ammonia ligase [Mucisphaera calidilacus]QDU72490.1 Glutamine synthetase [Mucisphaera calidilacus]
MTPKQVIALIKKEGIEYVDCRFMDFPGLWQHVTYDAEQLNEEAFETGFGFDGSSIRGWQAINESDMLLVPVADTAHRDPFLDRPTLAIICDIKDPVTRKQYSRDPRSIAKKAEVYLKQSKLADHAMFGPELEFFVFDSVHYDQRVNTATYAVDSVEGIWNRGSKDPANLGYQVRQREGYFPIPPMDSMTDLRSEMASVMKQMGLPIEAHHHEVATGGQAEIDLQYAPLLRMADMCMMYKYIVKQVAARHGRVATFMPKPLWGDNGSGMHTHFSLWKSGKPLFAGPRYAGLSQMALYAVGGILRHAHSLLALTNPTTNSFKRLVPGYEAPVHLCYSSRNRSAAIRIPVYHNKPGSKRIEFRCPDSSANPYLAFAAITMAAIDGIKNKIDPGEPLDRNIYDLEPETTENLDRAPADLESALVALEEDHDYLLEGDVFTQDVIHYWIRYKRENEIDALRQRPHPYEFCMYFDV